MIVSAVAVFENILPYASTFYAFGCQTNAIGCQQQGGPASSFLVPPEVSGCHSFPPVACCAVGSHPYYMGQGPK